MIYTIDADKLPRSQDGLQLHNAYVSKDDRINDTAQNDQGLVWPIRSGSATIEIRPTYIQNSTTVEQIVPEIFRLADLLFKSAKAEMFEYGVESEFSRELDDFVHKFDHIAIEAIRRVAFQKDVDQDVLLEALRTLGRIEHSPSYIERLRLLQMGLFAPSAQIRNGAALGLAYLDDPRAIPFIKQAIEREKLSWLRRYFQKVLDQLENTLKCRASSDI